MSIIYCADAIVLYRRGIVLIERLNDGFNKFALPGGKQELLDGIPEPLWKTALREVKEETGLTGEIFGVSGTYAEAGRDPRGNYVTTVFVMRGNGILTPEVGKTRPCVLDREQIFSAKKKLVFDHGRILSMFLAQEILFPG